MFLIQYLNLYSMRFCFFILVCIFSGFIANAQVGINTDNPDVSSMLDITSTNKGLLIPRVSLTGDNDVTTIASPANTLLVYNIATVAGINGVSPGFYYYNTATLRWIKLATGTTTGTTETASNGLTKTVNDIQLGGNLTANTVITQDNAESFSIANNATANTTVNLQNTGNFDVQDNGTSALFVDATSANIGLGTTTPVSKLAVNGATTIGSAYASTTANAAPTNGLRVQGQTIINKANGQDSRDIFSSHTSATAYNNVTGYLGQTESRAIAGYANSNGIGVFGQSNRSGYGVVGNTQAGTISLFAQGGEGVLGQADGATGVAGIPIGVHGIIDETAAGLRVATPVIGENNNITRGNGFQGGAFSVTVAQSVAGVYGNIGTRGATTGTNGYMFGVVGDILVISGTIPDGSGGVLGYSGQNTGGGYGMLGYNGLTSTIYSVYGGGANGSTDSANTGNKATESVSDLPNNRIGLGIYGGFMGGWVKGRNYGLATHGKEFGLYVQGNTLTKEPIVSLIDTENGSKSKTYATLSTSVDITARGNGTLVNGSVFISFDDSFKNIIAENEAIHVTITPTAETNGVFVNRVTKNGFFVTENAKGTSNASFNWLAIGTRKGYENGVELSKLIMSKDFDKNMDGVMSNEDEKTPATPIHFDGKEVKFEQPDPSIMPKGIVKKAPERNN